MAEKIILLDTSILIDFFRKTNKANSKFIQLAEEGFTFMISAITFYEVYSGASDDQLLFWERLLKKIEVLPLDRNIAMTAVLLNKELKLLRKQIALADLFIAATAAANDLPFATLNKKHFDRIRRIQVIE